MPAVPPRPALVRKSSKSPASRVFSPAIFRRRLLAWYDAHRRDLPWRKNRDPYRIWLSEIMLQQTRVAAVVEKYAQFLRLFPTVQALAASSQSAVLAAWSGLGYYRRARSLHEAARVIVGENGAKFPATAEDLRRLPGIGRYTAAAIASIAFSEVVAVVDGNVERVAERLVGRRLSASEIWETAELWLSPQRPGDFNQAMMELGATICLPGEPKCVLCPVAKFCATRGALPTKEKKPPATKATVFYALDYQNGKVRLEQRPKDAPRMPLMWELPEVVPNGTAPEVWLRLKHSITTTNYDVRVVRHVPGGTKTMKTMMKTGKRVALAQLEEIPLTGLARKILRAAEIL